MTSGALAWTSDALRVGAILRAQTRLEGMRIALATDTWAPQMNGVARTLARLADEIQARGGEVRIFTTSDPGAQRDDRVMRFASVPFWAYPQLRLAAPSSSQLSRALRLWGAHLVHAATPFGVGLAARSAARSLGIPFLTSYHTSLSAYANFYGLGLLSKGGWNFLRWFHNSGERTFCPTIAVARDLTARGFSNTAIWARGVDCERFSPSWRTAATRRSLGIDDREFLVTYVGRVAREKGMDSLLDGVARHQASGASPRARLMVVGDGPYLERCRKIAPNGTLFTGRRSGDELSRLFAASDLFVFPSITDTFGNVVIEAMASGVPVLAADCEVTREIAGDHGARFFMSNESTSLAHELQRLGCDPATRRALAAHGRARAERFSWDSVFNHLFDDYRSVALSATRSAPHLRSH